MVGLSGCSCEYDVGVGFAIGVELSCSRLELLLIGFFACQAGRRGGTERQVALFYPTPPAAHDGGGRGGGASWVAEPVAAALLQVRCAERSAQCAQRHSEMGAARLLYVSSA